ncbi:hypothetical protein APY04_1194 [Hyphomicrobium sulfonivorans]|uniref:Uncharacterized protein n=1 Tax=Hyphomicrobium sulfonivorans TaxID=121290 RepID=A0A125NVJ9_HYPSL|nr:hypothetical protein APY04_1194 [Hyphomicrobium sulfonivorans]
MFTMHSETLPVSNLQMLRMQQMPHLRVRAARIAPRVKVTRQC